MTDVIIRCPICGKLYSIELTDEQFEAYQRYKKSNVLIQDALPDLSADERESLKTGICNDCWNEMFGGDEDEENL